MKTVQLPVEILAEHIATVCGQSPETATQSSRDGFLRNARCHVENYILSAYFKITTDVIAKQNGTSRRTATWSIRRGKALCLRSLRKPILKEFGTHLTDDDDDPADDVLFYDAHEFERLHGCQGPGLDDE